MERKPTLQQKHKANPVSWGAVRKPADLAVVTTGRPTPTGTGWALAAAEWSAWDRFVYTEFGSA